MNKTVTPTETKTKTKPATRPPIVVVMGHIDHGKTTLLDYIRKTKVAEREAGGITQGIGAYQAEHQGRRITFIDTPGHETFSAMRARGAHVADIAILVVAADEGVKPQTEEAIKIAVAGELPMVVALTKIDRPNADPERAKQELAERSVLVEGYGGTVPVVEVSAKTGDGVDSLLETLLLLADLEELEDAAPDEPARGVVIESHLDPKRGASATLLVESGTVRRGEFIVIGDQVTPVRIFENFLGAPIDEAGAADPIRIAGFARAPGLGEQFAVARSRDEAEKKRGAPAQRTNERNEAGALTPAKTLVNIILKTDVLGSKEALEAALLKIGSPELGSYILKSEVGDIGESDVKLAAASPPAFIAGFRVRAPSQIKELAERSGVTIIQSDIIYELIDAIKASMVALAPASLTRVDIGKVRLLAYFKEERGKQIVGGRVEEGELRQGARFDIIRNSVRIGGGRVAGLQSQRRDVETVSAGEEFGLLAEADLSLAVGDTLAVFGEERIAPTL